MARILAIDYGTKRVGLAVSDPLQIIATSLDTIHAKDIIEYLKKYLEKEAVETFVVGVSKNLDGSDTNNTQPVMAFLKNLKKAFPGVQVHEVDERFTSKIALQGMIEAGSKKKDRQNKGNIDKLSAVIILQEFMNNRMP